MGVASVPTLHALHRWSTALTVTRAIEAAWPRRWWAPMVAIADAESGFACQATNGLHWGLYQIWTAWAPRDPAALLTCPGNLRVARHVWAVQGPTAWTAYTTGAYVAYLPLAAQLIAAVTPRKETKAMTPDDDAIPTTPRPVAVGDARRASDPACGVRPLGRTSDHGSGPVRRPRRRARPRGGSADPPHQRRWQWRKRPWHDAAGALLLLTLITSEVWIVLAGWGH